MFDSGNEDSERTLKTEDTEVFADVPLRQTKPTSPVRPCSVAVAAKRQSAIDNCASVETLDSPDTDLRSLPFHRELSFVSSMVKRSSHSPLVPKRRSFSYDELDIDMIDDNSKLTVTLSNAAPLLTEDIGVLKGSGTPETKCIALDEMLYMIERAWSQPFIGRELAYKLSDIVREEGGLDVLLSNLKMEEENCETQSDDAIMLMSAITLSQVLTVPNRKYLSRCPGALKTLVQTAELTKNNSVTMLLPWTTGILECLFKDSDETCRRLISLGGLDIIVYACRSFDSRVLRNCAAALANLALYSDADTQRAIESHRALNWLFPLALSGDDSVLYYALIAITALAANFDLESAVRRSDTLKLVEVFVTQHDPLEFGLRDKEHHHGQSNEWLRRLVPLLKSRCIEARVVAAFHFAVEASIRQRQGKMSQVFNDIGAIGPLKKIVVSKTKSKLAARLAEQALSIMQESLPRVLSQRVPLWNTEDVTCWIHQINAGDSVLEKAEELQLDGDILLLLTEKDLVDDLQISNGIIRKRFLRELNSLRSMADYTTCNTAELANWLAKLKPNLRCYTYRLWRAGVQLELLPQLSDQQLAVECGITNSIHRLVIIEAAKCLNKSTDAVVSDTARTTSQADVDQENKIDAFISYRRQNGKHLAGLLKAHLVQRGLNVYLDIESLRTGRFDEHLITSIRNSTNFLLVLTVNALDRCLGDARCKDWLHKEIMSAMDSGCTMIPVMDEEFRWPDEELLPEDIRSITKYQGISWAHQWQDACINKLVSYIKEECHIATPSVGLATSLGNVKQPDVNVQ